MHHATEIKINNNKSNSNPNGDIISIIIILSYY